MAEQLNIRIAQEYDIVCQEADDFILDMDVKNPDNTNYPFSGYTARMHVRRRRVESDPLVLAFATGGEGITLTSGHIKIEKAAADMEGLSGDYFYDLKLIDGDGVVTTWLFGKFKIFPTVTVEPSV